MGTPLHPFQDLFTPCKNRELFKVDHTPAIFLMSIKNDIDATIFGLYFIVYFTVIYPLVYSFSLISALVVKWNFCVKSFNKDHYTNVGM